MNWFGQGFSFSAKDDGATKTAGSVQKGLLGIGTALTTVAGAAAGFTLGSVLKMPDVRGAAANVQGIANDMRITTTNIEAFGVAADKASRKAMIGFNLTGKELKKAKSQIASTAFSMNIAPETAAEGMKALKQSAIEVSKIGFKSFEDFMKVMEVTGADPKQFAASMGYLQKQVGMTDKQLGDMLDTGVAIGKEYGLGAEAVQGMTDSARILQEEAGDMFISMGPDRTKKFILSIQNLAGAFMKAGHTAAEAEQLSKGLGQTLIKGEQGMAQLYTGIGEDMPDSARILTENMGSVNSAFELLKSSPTEFMEKMIKVASIVKKSAKDPELAMKRFGEQLTANFGPGVTDMVLRSGDATVKSLEGVDNKLKSGSLKGHISDLAKGYSDGRTMAERFAIAQDMFRTKLKHLDGALMTDSKFLHGYKHSTELALNALKPMAAGDGLMAKSIRMMINFSNFGVGGMLASLHPLGPAIASMIQQFGPVLQMMPALIGVFTALASPVTIIIGGILLLNKYLGDTKKGGSAFTSTVDTIFNKAMEFIGKFMVGVYHALPVLWDMIVKAFDAVPWGKVGGFLSKAVEAFVGALPHMISRLMDGIAFLLGAAWKGISDYFDKKFGAWAVVFKAGVLAVAAAVAAAWMVAVLGPIGAIVVAAALAVAMIIKYWDKIVATVTASPIKAGANQAQNYLQEMKAKFAAEDAVATIKEQQKIASIKLGYSSVANMQMAAEARSISEQNKRLDEKELNDRFAEALNMQADHHRKKKKMVADAAKDQAAESAKYLDIGKKAFGADTGQAVDIMKSVSGTTSAQFAKKMGEIRSAYLGFLGAVRSEGEKIMVQTRLQFTKFLTSQTTFWNSMATMIMLWLNTTRISVSKFWSDIILQAENQATGLLTTISKMISRMKSMVAGVDLMMIMTPEAKIIRWAYMVVAALQSAFTSANPIDAAFRLASKNASSLLSSFTQQTGKMQPLVSQNFQQVSSTNEQMEAVDQIIFATNNPKWADRMTVQLDTLHEDLMNIAAGQPIGGKQGSKSPAHHNREGGDRTGPAGGL